jgi:chromosome segregation ATPase
MQANKEAENAKAAAQTAAAAANAKGGELSQDQALIAQITDAFNQKQSQIDQLNAQLQAMQAQGINPNDPNFQAVVSALNQANGDLANLQAQKQAADAEYAKDKQDLASLQQFAQAAAQAAAQAQADAAAANQNFNSLVSGANLPSSGYSPTIPQGSAPTGGDIFSSLTSNPLALLAVGGLAFVVLSGRRGN